MFEAEGRSHQNIAEELGLTVKQVRFYLTYGRLEYGHQRATKRRKLSRSVVPEIGQYSNPTRQTKESAMRTRAVLDKDPPKPTGKNNRPIVDIIMGDEKRCKWPVDFTDQSTNYVACGEPVADPHASHGPTRSYCPHCAAEAIGKGTGAERYAASVLKKAG